MAKEKAAVRVKEEGYEKVGFFHSISFKVEECKVCIGDLENIVGKFTME